ncbi:MAG: serine/threonine protein kinase, partial [Chitinophagaceae bacterium]
EVTFPAGLSDAERQVLRERTHREARAAARLEHPSAVTVYDVVEEEDDPFLVMELVDAPTLAEVIRSGGPLTPQRTAQIGLDLLGALEAAHAQGILHRDVKPANVLVRGDGRVVLTDFGIATATGDSSITHTGMLLGSPAYIAPERARGEQPGPPSDLWSLGATLFTAVEGTPPYDAGEALLTVTAVVTGEHAPFAAAGPLEPVLEALLEKDPAARLDLPAARRLLTPIAARSPVPGTKVLPAPPAGTRRAERTTAVPLVRPSERRRPGWLLPALLALAVVIAAAGVLLATTADEPGTSTAAPEVSASPSAPAASEPEASAPGPSEPATPDAAALPAGWTTDTGAAGWTVALPPGYEQTREGEYVQADTGRTLRIDSGPGKPDAVADRRAQAEDFERRHPSYEKIRIDAVDYRGYEAADWEFTYRGLHVLNRVFVVDGQGYSLYLQAPQRDAEGVRQDLVAVAERFEPA